MPKRLPINKGDRFNSLTIIEEKERRIRERTFLCKCDCGKETIVRLSCLRSNKTVSCGCVGAKHRADSRRSHGLSHTTFYRKWWSIKRRCICKYDKSYHNYGGRGITLSEDWMTFKNFHRDMFEDYERASSKIKNVTIDRIDNDKGYSKDNCRWVSNIDNANNTRKNIFLEFQGKRHTVSQWSRIVGIHPETLYSRIKKGLSTEEVLTRPVRLRKINK